MGNEHVKGSPNGARKCYEFGHINNRGEPCGANVIAGTTGCRKHVGKRPEVAKAEGAVVVELRRLGLTAAEMVDPGETLLRLVAQSAARVELYSSLLEEAMDAADRLARAGAPPQSDLLGEETARLDLERVLNHGAVSALIGHTYSGTQQNGVIATGEAIRGLAKLEADERDRCANFAARAVAAGLAERQVRLAEQQGALLASVIRSAMADVAAAVARRFGADPAELIREFEPLAIARVASLAGSPVIEGSVAA